MSAEQEQQAYRERLEYLLENYLLPGKKAYDPGMKVIHDPLWGSRLFYPWEIALLDTPLCQRLRQIHQLGTAFLTYPSATHNRFSHTLGVMILAGRLISRLKEKAEILDLEIQISRKDIYTVRMAGLLHDIGHCFFSHASEKALESIVAKVRKSMRIGKPKPHEFFSYLIVTSEYFKKYYNEHIVPLFKQREFCPDLKDVANIIIRIPPSKEKRYLQDIISGPYDVDKLEYLYRDSRMAGLEISYDIERYFYKIRLYEKPKGSWRLVMDQGGVNAIEQIIFSKMMLFSFVYHHQKVLVSDMLIFDMVLELLEKNNERIKIEHPLDLLRYTDFDLFSISNDGTTDRFNEIRDRILKRDLPKRCFVVNREYVTDLENDIIVKDNWKNLLENVRDIPDGLKKVRKDICEKMKSLENCEEFSIDDIHINFPKVPTMDEASTSPVLGIDGELHSIAEFFDLEGWRTTYELKKLKGYFFITTKYKEKAAPIIEQYIKDEYGLNFDDRAKLEAKIT